MNLGDGNAKMPVRQFTSIPNVLTSFIGRRREVIEVQQRLADSRLLTLTGAAGCGKTRLAIRALEEVGHAYIDGIYWIELAQLTDAHFVPQTLAKALTVVEQPGEPLIAAIIDHLRDKHVLLILDNCEHVLGACAQLVGTLLAGPDVTILTTSREPLSVAGERLYVVPPMRLPPPNLSLRDADQFDAIKLFVERARAVVPQFVLTHENLPVVVSICRQLDGLPLAIELACARVNVLTVEQIAMRLDDRLTLLTSTAAATGSHHRTLRAAIDWSYELLSEPEQVLLRRLTVFSGGCSLSTVEVVCVGNGIDRTQVLELLSTLVNRSLVAAQTLQRSEARYTLLETIRQYAEEKLTAAEELTALRDRHLESFLELAEQAVPRLRGAYQQLWLNWLEAEYDNIRAALTWALDSDQIEAGLRIAIALYEAWTTRDYVEEGFSWLERLLARVNTRVSPRVHAMALVYAGLLAGFRGNSAAQMAYGREGVVVAEAAGDQGKQALAWALGGQAHAARAAEDYETEYRLARRAIQLHRESGDTYFLGLSLSTTSFSAMALGKYDEAHAMLDEALTLLRPLGNPYRLAMALNFSGDLARCERKYDEAEAAYVESIALLRTLNAIRDLASVLHNLGHVRLHIGDVAGAEALFTESLAIQQAQRNTMGAAECLIGFAALVVACGLPAAGVRLLAAVVSIGGSRVASAWAATRMEYEHYLTRARAGLMAHEFETAQMEGRSWDLEQAVAYVQKLPIDLAASLRAPEDPTDSLTEREREIVVLVAQAKSNGDIAEELVLSKRTVEKHIAHIRAKLGFTERVQIARWAIETGLVARTE